MSKSEADVPAAFTIVVEVINAAIEEVNQENIKAITARDYDKVQGLTQRARAMEEFRDRVGTLQQEWQKLAQGATPSRSTPPSARKKVRSTKVEPVARKTRQQGERSAPGLRTPESAYRLPIARALVELGGKARSTDVLDRVYAAMSDTLNEHDHEPNPSLPNVPRWRNTAQWSRFVLVKRGLLQNDTPHGVWAISEKGEAWLKKQEKAAASPLTPSLFSTLDWQGIEHGLEPLPQRLGDALRVFRLMHSHRLSYNDAARAVAEHRGLSTVNTVYDSCTRRIEISADRFRELVQSPTLLLRHLSRRYPQYASALEELIIDEI